MKDNKTYAEKYVEAHPEIMYSELEKKNKELQAKVERLEKDKEFLKDINSKQGDIVDRYRKGLEACRKKISTSYCPATLLEIIEEALEKNKQ